MPFNPNENLMKLKGKDYLPVAARLQWLNDQHGRFTITTEFLRLEETYAVAKATVTILDDAGNVLKTAQGTKREDKRDFADFESKAETGAVGRALGMLGFGTQFAPEFDETDGITREPRVVDSPLEPASAVPAGRAALSGLTPASKIGAPTNKNKPRPEPEPVAAAAPAAEAGDDLDPFATLEEYDHAGVTDDDLFSEAKVRRLMSIGGKLFNLKGEALEDRLCHAASKILGRNVADLHALHWKDGNDVMKKLEEEAVKRGLWEPAKA